MRIGLAEKTVLVALAQASVYSEKSSSKNQASFDEVTSFMFHFIGYGCTQLDQMLEVINIIGDEFIYYYNFFF
jgi:hypothetical protein